MLLVPLIKADSSTRRVVARLDEGVDRQGEAMDYDASAPIIKAWSDAQLAASGGKSRGNIRGQHTRTAAGRVVDIEFDDVSKSVTFDIDVVDDAEWEKVCKGVYTGISPKGKAKRTKGADGVTRFALSHLEEISLVDLPCLPGAVFTLVKADGESEAVAFLEREDPAPAVPDTDLLKALASAPTLRQFGGLVAALPADDLEKALAGSTHLGGEVRASLFSAATRRDLAASGAALPDGSFPVTDQIDLEAGLEALSKAADSDAARAHLVARAVALDLADILPDGMAPATPTTIVEKGLNSVSRLAGLIDSLTWLAGDVACEASYEADGSAVPGRLAAWISEGAVILVAMAGEEASEAVAGLKAAVAALPVMVVPADVQKAAGLGDSGLELLLKVSGDLASIREELSKAYASTATDRAELAKLRALPAPGGAHLRAVGRSDDIGGGGGGSAGSRAAETLATIEAMPDGVAKARAMTRFTMTASVAAPRN
jgi:hypothetical protein